MKRCNCIYGKGTVWPLYWTVLHRCHTGTVPFRASDYSTVHCTCCGATWHTRADYVGKLNGDSALRLSA